MGARGQANRLRKGKRTQGVRGKASRNECACMANFKGKRTQGARGKGQHRAEGARGKANRFRKGTGKLRMLKCRPPHVQRHGEGE